MSVSVFTFYRFVTVPDPARMKAVLLERAEAHSLRGTILIAREGINATLSGLAEDSATFIAWLESNPLFRDLVVKRSVCEDYPFKRLKVKVKPEIVTFGQADVDPINGAGTYVAPQDWNALIQSPDVVVIDTRNSYEFDIGTFEGAINPKTRAFRDFPSFVKANLDPVRHRKVAMFCTGGIRCEKATAYMRAHGFAEVYHLEGGILNYLEVVPPERSLWQGECFIFDERVALDHGVRVGHHRLCTACGYPVTCDRDNANKDVCPSCGEPCLEMTR